MVFRFFFENSIRPIVIYNSIISPTLPVVGVIGVVVKEGVGGRRVEVGLTLNQVHPPKAVIDEMERGGIGLVSWKK